ncbi:hypothetical protein VPH35_065245 [Triticum aestivum]
MPSTSLSNAALQRPPIRLPARQRPIELLLPRSASMWFASLRRRHRRSSTPAATSRRTTTILAAGSSFKDSSLVISRQKKNNFDRWRWISFLLVRFREAICGVICS